MEKMIPLSGIISLTLLTLCSVSIFAESNVPVYMWNIDTDASVNPLTSLNSEELINRLSPTLNNKPIILFMQDELSVEDFKSEDLVSLKLLAEGDNDGTFYAPSVTETGKLPALMEAKGYRSIRVKSHKDFPASKVQDNTILVVDLPITQLGDSRGDNLSLNGNVMSDVYERLKAKIPGVIGMYTAKKNSKLQMEESRRRITRNAPGQGREEVGADINKFINITQTDGQLFLYLEKAPILKIKDENKTEWANFTLSQPADTTGTVLNQTSATSLLVLTYTNLAVDGNMTSSMLNKAVIKFEFATKQGYWYISQTTLSYDVKINNNPFTVNDLVLVTTDISTPLGFSWHCSPKSQLATYGYSFNGTIVTYTNKVIFETNGFQLQPFTIINNKFGHGYDCVGFFTEGIWAAIFLGLIIAMMLAWAVSMLADVRTPDRYDDPKGKTITVTATD